VIYSYKKKAFVQPHQSGVEFLSHEGKLTKP